MTSNPVSTPGKPDAQGFWLNDKTHRNWLMDQAMRQFDFFQGSIRPEGGFYTLAHDGSPLNSPVQELHTTTRLIHSYALGHLLGVDGADRIVETGMAYLQSHHKDPHHGGFVWAMSGDQIADDRKLAYGHFFVLLAAASAKLAGHPNADRLLQDVRGVLDAHFWDEDAALFCDELNRDWTPFSTYRGMNANMHGVEAMLAAFEATGEAVYLDRSGRILDFFINQVAAQEHWRLPEHYTENWDIDRNYAGDPMFRPAGTTPGHSFELGRLQLQHWDLSGRPNNGAPLAARRLIEQALNDAWLPDGGFAYTLDFQGQVDSASRFWWPVTEAIGAVAALITLEQQPQDEVWYRRLWQHANATHIDHQHGGWFPAVDDAGQVTSSIFEGKPDIYHAVQACLFPLSGRLSRMTDGFGTTEAMRTDLGKLEAENAS